MPCGSAHPKHSDSAQGFTLLEILLVLLIVAILSAIALPAYTGHVARARRAEARVHLLQVAQFMQRFYAANDNYQKDRADNDVLAQMPANLRQSPSDGNAVYTLDIPPATLSASHYVLHMVPRPGASMARDKCGTFTLSSTGLRGVLVQGAAGSTALRDSCWQ
jgi:type IV pilus assembly protein PilE